MPYQAHIRIKHVAVGALLLGLTWPALAQQKAGPSCPPRPIVLGLYEFGRFYHAGTGLDKDIAEQMAARSGCKFELRVMMRGRIWQDLQSGNVDMTLSASATPERTMFAWATPYMWVRNVMILSKDVDTRVRSTSDFIATPNLRLGVARGYFQGKAYDGFISQLRNLARVEEIDDTERLYAMFKAGRFQAMLGTQLVYSNYFKDSEVRIEDWDVAGPKGATNLLISKKNFSHEEAKRWADLMKAMVNDGSMLRMLGQYAEPADAARMLLP